jgi:hypothetical protein
MKLITKIQLSLALAVGLFTTSAIAGPGGHSPSDFPRHVTSKEEAVTCCTAKAKVAMACTSCKTLDVKEGEKDKSTILSWFAPDSKHDCPGCGGKVTMSVAGSGKAGVNSEYTHTCSKCGDKSAYVCTDHKKA